ncbi:GIY-YIG nuclease family protein [Candidatus Kuenenbacteria bacterium]|nr:GIY-YIG nuclease family protein [Candidatus Kuenenbacteria bacterium]
MSTTTQQLKSLPPSPGIYLFYNSKGELIYIGKATSLKSRVKSYFSIGQKNLRPIESMIHEVKNIKTIKTDSVLEAIILEGNYIKKYRPKYNVDWKDDKSWNYLAITNEKFSRLITIRQHEINLLKEKSNWKLEIGNWKFLYGPFPSLNTGETLKILHKLFYVSRCSPPLLPEEGVGGGGRKKPCFDYQLGSCLGVCTGEITGKDYREKVIKPLTEFLKGNKKRLLSNLKKQMTLASRQQNFEEAARLRNQIKSLSHIQDVTLLNKDLFTNNFGNWKPARPAGGLEIGNSLQSVRIEAYDISNLGPTGKVGSMVVFDNHGPVKSEYRKFKIKTVSGQSDVDCLKEIITRRFNNNWPLPDLILIDGGVPQVNAVKNVLPTVGAQNLVPRVIGIAKGPTRKKNEFIFDKNNQKIAGFIQANENLLIHARDEAHRFAISYQKKLRKI